MYSMISFVLLAVIYFAALPLSAGAYIDPGTGSFVVQAILAAIFGVALYTKFFWRKIKDFFNKRITQQNAPKDKE